MNERIKTIWEEATLSHWPRPGKFTAGEYDSHLEKFAEMIVLACADELIKWKDEPFPYDPEFGASLIKSLFGVK